MKIKLEKWAYKPVRAHETDAGMDLLSPISVRVPARGSAIIDTGVHVELPACTVGMLKSKSGLNVKYNIVSEGVIDEGYTGSVLVKLYNHGKDDYFVELGDKITQLVVLPCRYEAIEIVDDLGNTERGDNGFGSTGK